MNLGTTLSNSLKWCENSNCLNSKIQSRFYAFSKFKHFKPNAYQRDHFIKTLIFPVLTYNIELWYFSATVNDRKRLLKHFNRNNFSVDVDSFVVERIHSIASNYASWDDHILNECYSCPRSQYLLPRIRTSRFLNSFIPTSIKVLNHRAIPWYHCNLSITKLPNKSYLYLYIVTTGYWKRLITVVAEHYTVLIY